MKLRAPDSDLVLSASGLLVSILALGLTVAMQETESRRVLVGLPALGIIACFSVFVFAETLSRAWRLLLFWLQSALILTLYILAANSFIAILGIVWIVQAETLFGVRRAIPLLVLSALAYGLCYALELGDTFSAVTSGGLFALFQVFALTTAYRASRERGLREQTAALNRELLATRQLLSQSAAQGERVRIARDLHDILGHHMTALILNLEVAGRTLDSPRQSDADDNIRARIDQALALARLLLSDIRTAVSELRSDDRIDLTRAVDKLVDGIPRPRFEIDIAPDLASDDLELAEALLRCIQEAVTNVIRHSDAGDCRIAVTRQGDTLTLRVSDNGAVSRPVVPGNGLRGMEERAREAGGSLHWEAGPDGFSLYAEFSRGIAP